MQDTDSQPLPFHLIVHLLSLVRDGGPSEQADGRDADDEQSGECGMHRLPTGPFPSSLYGSGCARADRPNLEDRLEIIRELPCRRVPIGWILLERLTDNGF